MHIINPKPGKPFGPLSVITYSKEELEKKETTEVIKILLDYGFFESGRTKSDEYVNENWSGVKQAVIKTILTQQDILHGVGKN